MEFVLFALGLLWCTTALCRNTAPAADQTPTLETTGHGFWRPHRPFVFKIFSTPNGTKVRVDFLTFNSRKEAKQYLQAYLRPRTRIIYHQEKKEPNGEIIGERVVGVWQKSGKKEFYLIHGVRLNYFFMGSPSLAAAIQVEEVIEE